MPKNIQTIQRLEKVLEQGPMNPHQIMDEYKKRWPKSQPSMARLSNLLSRHKQFIHVSESMISNTTSGGNNQYFSNSYRVKVWALNQTV